MKGRLSKKWSFPKGHRERSDRSTLDCALRELKEETGLNLNQDYEGVKKFKSAEYYIYHVPMEYRPFPKDSNEVEDAGWFSMEEIVRLSKNVDVSLYCHHMRAEKEYSLEEGFSLCIAA